VLKTKINPVCQEKVALPNRALFAAGGWSQEGCWQPRIIYGQSAKDAE
jgi:hypothetical protein